LESVLGALYLSTHTSELIRPWLDLHWSPIAEAVLQDPALQNYKDALQELTQSRSKLLPTYQVSQPAMLTNDEERFIAEVFLQGQLLGVGKGRSKKAAEQEAAKEAFFKLRSPPQSEVNSLP
jgi:ribonuclease-3